MVLAHTADRFLGTSSALHLTDRTSLWSQSPDWQLDCVSSFRRCKYNEVALDAEGGREVSFHHVVSNPAYSGLRERRYDRPNETVEIISVRSARLDDLVADGQRVTFVKIDVEGGELGVLQGGLQMLAEQRPGVVFEHGLGASDYYETRPEDVYDLLVGSWSVCLATAASRPVKDPLGG